MNCCVSGYEMTSERKAILYLVISIIFALVWPVSNISEKVFHIWSPFTWTTCLSIVLISYSRVLGVKHPLPCTELFVLLSSFAGGIAFATVISSNEILSLDQFLLKVDENFGLVWIGAGKLFAHFTILHHICWLVYHMLPLAGTLLYLVLPDTAARWKYVGASALGYTIMLCYRICPAA